jgi:hypothetical protein
MKAVRTDEVGQILGVAHHDGTIEQIRFPAPKIVQVDIKDSEGNLCQISLEKCRYFAANNLREGNVIDRMYLWQLTRAPATMVTRASKIFHLDVLSLAQKNEMTNLFVLESSYGVEIFAIVEEVVARSLLLELR